jgi:hypothetical protein
MALARAFIAWLMAREYYREFGWGGNLTEIVGVS